MITDDTCAVFLTVKDPGRLLSVWLRYYGRHFAPHNIFILDHDSVDGSMVGVDASIVRAHNPKYNDNQWHVDIARRMQQHLFARYQYVLYAHADEFIVADPERYPGGLSEYILANTQPVVRCDGRGVVHHSSEADLDWGRPVFDQRRHWYRDIHDCKPLLANRPLDWAWGFHHERDYPDRPADPNLILVHLHRADLATTRARHAWMREQTFQDGQGEAGFHHKWSDEEVLADMKAHQDRAELIPERFGGGIL